MVDKFAQAVGDAAIKHVADEARERALDLQAKIYEQAAAYTNLVIVGGYAGAFAIWGFSKDVLTVRGVATIALLLGTSLAAFVAYEVYKMIWTATQFKKWWSALKPNRTPQDTLAQIKALEVQMTRQPFQGLLFMWIAMLVVAVGGALGALILLFYSCAATLLELPKWP